MSPESVSEVHAATRTEAPAITHKVCGKVSLPKVFKTTRAFDRMVKAVVEQQCPFFRAQFARSSTIEMANLIANECNGLIGRNQLMTSWALRRNHFGLLCRSLP
jgi:hypothetical protein